MLHCLALSSLHLYSLTFLPSNMLSLLLAFFTLLSNITLSLSALTLNFLFTIQSENIIQSVLLSLESIISPASCAFRPTRMYRKRMRRKGRNTRRIGRRRERDKRKLRRGVRIEKVRRKRNIMRTRKMIPLLSFPRPAVLISLPRLCVICSGFTGQGYGVLWPVRMLTR